MQSLTTAGRQSPEEEKTGMATVADQTRALYEHDELPDGLLWINDLSPRHQRLFYGEIQFEWSRYCLTNNLSGLVEFFEDWKATAETDANPELSAALLGEHGEDEYDPWKSTQAG